jgi:hypothetical protein
VQATRYRFVSRFAVPARRARVHDVLLDLERYSEWWPQVRAVGKLDDDRALVVCRSALPYDLELELTAVSRDPHLLEVALDGPIRGWARFHLDDDGPGATSLRFEEEVRAEAVPVVLASYVVKPLLSWNHQRMMKGLESGLRSRLGAAPEPGVAS